MNTHFLKVKNYLLDLECEIALEHPEEQTFVVNKIEAGIVNMVIGCAAPILIMEQYLVPLPEGNTEIYKKLLRKNRDIIHGAFVLDETGTKVIFRDTLQIENLDRNELEGSLNALGVLLSEYSDALISFSKK